VLCVCALLLRSLAVRLGVGLGRGVGGGWVCGCGCGLGGGFLCLLGSASRIFCVVPQSVRRALCFSVVGGWQSVGFLPCFVHLVPLRWSGRSWRCMGRLFPVSDVMLLLLRSCVASARVSSIGPVLCLIASVLWLGALYAARACISARVVPGLLRLDVLCFGPFWC